MKDIEKELAQISDGLVEDPGQRYEERRQAYRKELDSMQITSESDLIQFCRYAARLYEFGDKEYIPKADALLCNNSFNRTPNELFAAHIEAGVESIDGLHTGIRLAEGLISLWDTYVFFRHTSYPFCAGVREDLDSWVKEAHYVDSIGATYDYIIDFFDSQPVMAEDVLEDVMVPRCRLMLELEYLLSGHRYVDVQPEYVDGGWEFSDAEYDLRLEFKPRDEDGLLRFEIYEQFFDEKIPAEGVRVRQDILPALQDHDSPLGWSIDYRYFPGLDTTKRMLEPLTVHMPMGGICKIPVPTVINND